MVDNSNLSGNKTKTTEKYRLHTDSLNDGLARLLADQAYFRSLVNSKSKMSQREGRVGLVSTTTQIARQRAAIRNDRTENEAAFRRGEIYKFWK